VFRAGEKYRGSGNPRDVALRDLIHDRADRRHRFAHARCNGRGSQVPHLHDPVDQPAQHQRYVAPVNDLEQIGCDERDVDNHQSARDRPGGDQAPAPDLAHGDKQQHGRDNGHADGDRDGDVHGEGNGFERGRPGFGYLGEPQHQG